MNDDRLREAFAQLRRGEVASAPRFAALWQPRPRGALLPRLALAALLLIVVTASLSPLLRRQQQPSISAWKAPTDFLLATPGRELLQSTPDLRGDLP